VEEQNAPGFYYIVRWRRLAAADNSSRWPPAGGGGGGAAAEYQVHERTIDAATDTLTLSGQPVYRPYEMVVLAANEMGEAAPRPRTVVGYSSEAGTSPPPSHLLRGRSVASFSRSENRCSSRS